MSNSNRPASQDTADLLARASEGDPVAFDALISHVSLRLCAIAHRMISRYPRVRRWEDTDDVLQEGLLRLHRALSEVRPTNVGGFFGLAATIMRRLLIDLSRHYYGVYGMGAKHQSGLNSKIDDAELAIEHVQHMQLSEQLEQWAAFHSTIDTLPELEKEAFSLAWYSGLSQRQISVVLEVSERTVIRRMNRARIALYHALDGQQPPI